MVNSTEQKLTESEYICNNIIHHINSLEEEESLTVDNLVANTKKDLEKLFLQCFDQNNKIFKDIEFKKEIKSYKYGIFNTLEIPETVKTKITWLISSIVQKLYTEMDDNIKKQIAEALEEEISKHLNDMVLGLWDVRKKLKDNEDAMKRFNDLALIFSESSTLVKDNIIEKLNGTLQYINNHKIQGIDYKHINKITEIEDSDEVLQQWDIMIPPSQTIEISMDDTLNNLIYAKDINKDPTKQRKLNNALRFFKTLANHLPELIGKKNNFLSLSSIHLDENSFFKRFTRSALKDKSSEQLAEEINDLYNKASEDPENRAMPEGLQPIRAFKPSLLDKYKSLSPQMRLLIVLVIIIVAIAASLLLFYFLSHKEAGNQVVV
ncbi:hypothetical protein NEOKW01_0017 [Nematocida sp. AWRm80]|nr:hypothetical protein NEOKW01_0017 [Nematocida sp. AWRm80]